LYRKRKRASTDSSVDKQQMKEEIKQELKAEMKKDMLDMMARGYQVVFALVSNCTSPSPAGLKSSCASADNVGLINDTTELLTEVLHIAYPTQEDLIGMLTEPTYCGLWIIFHSVECEVAIGVVQPEQTTLHTIPSHENCVVVEVLHVYFVFRDHVLEHPPNDEVTTLEQAGHQKIQ
jgi:hypothetical protein